MFLNIKFYFEVFVDLVVVVRNSRDPIYPLAIPPQWQHSAELCYIVALILTLMQSR